jgi:hypothetical protein
MGMADHLHGATASGGDIQMLMTRLGTSLVPDWLASLLKEYKLAGTEFSLSADDDRSSLGADVLWLTPAQMASESCECQPGLSLRGLAFVPIGACATGSGDYYYLDLRDDSFDPPVVRIPHDFAGEGPASYPLERIELVAQRLSEFFRNGMTRK